MVSVGLSGILLAWLAEFLQSRSQSVKLNNWYSHGVNVISAWCTTWYYLWPDVSPFGLPSRILGSDRTYWALAFVCLVSSFIFFLFLVTYVRLSWRQSAFQSTLNSCRRIRIITHLMTVGLQSCLLVVVSCHELMSDGQHKTYKEALKTRADWHQRIW